MTLNFVDVERTNTTFNIYHNAITNSINAQDDSYQIIANYAYYGTSLCTQGIYMNLNTIEYLDLEQPWWNPDYREEATVHDKLYYIVGDVTTSATERMVVTYVNRDLADQYFLGLDLYAVVDGGKWTLDYQNELIANVIQRPQRQRSD